MRFLRRSSADEPAPDWASPMDAGEYAAFMRLVVEILGQRLTSPTPNEGGGLEVVDESGNRSTVGLANLAQVCHHAPRSEWPGVIATHFSAILEKPEAAPSSIEEARPMLRVRLIPDDFEAGSALGELATRPVADGLRAALVLDHPRTISYVTTDVSGQWQTSAAELFEIAIDNVRQHEKPTVERIAGEVPLTFLLGDSFYVASNLLLLDDFLDPRTPHGAIAAAPNRHMVVFQPIVDLSIAGSINAVLPIIHQAYREGPAPISPDLFWWRDGQLTLLPVRIENGNVGFYPPPEFVEVLNTLPSA